MGTERLIINEEYLQEVVKVIEAGVAAVKKEISTETRIELLKWCKEMKQDG